MKSLSKKTLAICSGMALLVSGASVAWAQTSIRDQRGQLSERDYKFVVDAARGGMLEVNLGELAHQKGSLQAVRDFGQMMVTDHTKANDELKRIVTQKGAMLPATLSHHEQSTLESLQTKLGKDFDKDYAADMVKDHRTDLKDFESAAKDLSDPDLRAFAQKTIPILEKHLRMAKDMEASVKTE